MAFLTLPFFWFCICSAIARSANASNENHQHAELDDVKTLENEFQNLRNYVRSLENTIKEMTEQHEGQIQHLRDELEGESGEIEIKTGESSKEVSDNRMHRRMLFQSTPAPDPVHSKQVAFSFDLSKDATNLGHHHTIIYDHELLNLGDGYNKHDGIFTVPVSGIYLFNWSTMTAASVYQGTELVVNGNLISPSFSSDTSGYESSGKTVLIGVTRGNTVWIRTDAATSTDRTAHALRGDGYNSFSGYLVYPQE